MPGAIASKVCRCLAITWPAFTSLALLIISVQAFQDPVFPINIGAIRTVGRSGLLITLLPGAVGLAAVALTLLRVRFGLRLLGIYALFWAGVLLAAFPSIWNAKSSFCFRTVCITSPWFGRFLLFALTLPFVLVVLWAYRELRIERRFVPA